MGLAALDRRRVGLVAAITLAGAVLRFATLDSQSFWLDEAFTVDRVEGGFSAMLSKVADHEVHPPLYFGVAWLWKQVFGSGEVGLRSLSALLGTALIPLAYALGHRLGGFRVGCFVAALAATSPLLVWYSQEARGYSLLLLLGGLSLLCFLAARTDFDRRWLAGWAVSSALAMAAHYFALFLVAPELVWLLLEARRRGALLEVSIAAAAVVAVGLALLPLALHQREVLGAKWIAEGHSGDMATRIAAVPAEFLTGRRAPYHAGLSGVGLVLALLATLPLLGADREWARRAAFVPLTLATIALAVPLLLAIAGSDYLITRNVIVAWLPLTIVVALGAAAARFAPLGTMMIATLCGFGMAIIGFVAFNVRHQRDDWRTAAEAVASQPSREPRALIVTPSIGGAAPLEVYLPSSREMGETQAVSEIDLLSLATREPGGPLETPRPPNPPPPARGFESVARVEGSTFTLVRYQADRPMPVSAPMLEDRTLTGARGAVFLLP
jgi:4-amino-4-deoxy-L-arabinose transferase-like glycosyltransferase